MLRRNVAELARKQRGVFTWAQTRVEYTPAEVQTLISKGEWVRVFQGVYRERTTPLSPALSVEAARLSMGADTAVACYSTAAALHGFSVVADPATHVLTFDGRISRGGSLFVHRDNFTPGTLTMVDGTPTTRPARTAIDLARVENRLDAMATLDLAMRTGVSRSVLLDEMVRHRGKRGVRQARELIVLADARAESPMESRMRLRCIDAGLPRPEPQYEIRVSGRTYRFDLAWPAYRIGLEYESGEWHTGVAAANRDNPRHNVVTHVGWTMFYATAPQVYRSPRTFTAPILRAIASA